MSASPILCFLWRWPLAQELKQVPSWLMQNRVLFGAVIWAAIKQHILKFASVWLVTDTCLNWGM